MMITEDKATESRVKYLLGSFNYRAAQTARSCRVRNLKTRMDLINFGIQRCSMYERSDWMFAVHSLENKRLREFLVFEDWAEQLMTKNGEENPDLHFDHGHYPSEHLYAWLEVKPRTYSEIEELWIGALNTYKSLGGGAMRPEMLFASVGIVAREHLWPAELEATLWDPTRAVDSSWLHGIMASAEIQHINAMTQGVNGTLWVRVAPNDALQLYLPFRP